MRHHKEGYILRKLQRGLSAIEMWCECWNIKINEDKTWAFYFSHRLRPPEAHHTLNGWNIPFINDVKFLGVVFDKRITRRLHIEMTDSLACQSKSQSYFTTGGLPPISSSWRQAP
jgi:hypothetical protein